MYILNDVITYVRRIVKTPSNIVLTDNLIIDYINRFWISDVDARMQLFDFKTKYQFQTTPGIDQYNMPLYSVQVSPSPQEPTSNVIASYPVYQGFTGNCTANGIYVPFSTQMRSFNNLWPTYVQQEIQVGTGNGGTNYNLNLPFFPAIPGHIDMLGIMASVTPPSTPQDPIFGTTLNLNVPTTSVYSAVYFTATGPTGENIIAADSGQFFSGGTNGDLYGLMMTPGNAPLGNLPMGNGIVSNFYSTTLNTVNYNTGQANVTFSQAIPDGVPINAQCYFVEPGMPRSVFYFNNIITLMPPPNTQYLIELEAYLTPAAFLSTSQAIPFGYMTEYIARGAAQKILSDTMDTEQYMFYQPLFLEQESLVWKRSQRQFTSTRTETIYSRNHAIGGYNNTNNNSSGV